jgi:hypothetical protein
MPVRSLTAARKTERVQNRRFARSRSGSRRTVLGTGRVAFPECFFAIAQKRRVARYAGRIDFSTFVVTTSAVVRFAPILR